MFVLTKKLELHFLSCWSFSGENYKGAHSHADRVGGKPFFYFTLLFITSCTNNKCININAALLLTEEKNYKHTDNI
jgi:hypothetical protein